MRCLYVPILRRLQMSFEMQCAYELNDEAEALILCLGWGWRSMKDWYWTLDIPFECVGVWRLLLLPLTPSRWWQFCCFWPFDCILTRWKRRGARNHPNSTKSTQFILKSADVLWHVLCPPLVVWSVRSSSSVPPLRPLFRPGVTRSYPPCVLSTAICKYSWILLSDESESLVFITGASYYARRFSEPET